MSCARCAEKVRAARSHAALLRALARPAIPPALASRSFLDGIYERALTASAETIAPVLVRGLTPALLPLVPELGHMIARAAVDAPATARALAALPQIAPPNGLWQRIRGDLDRQLVRRARLRRLPLVMGAAAVLVLTAILVITRRGAPLPSDSPVAHGTRQIAPNVEEPHIAFVEVREPLSLDLSPTLLISNIARGR